MKSNILNAHKFNLVYAGKLVDDVADERMCQQPGDVPNHPAWVLGHLATSCDFGATQIGGQGLCGGDWGQLFGNGSTPVADRARYPDKATLLKALEDGHHHLAALYEKVDDAALGAELPMENMRPIFPTVGDLIVFLLTSHESTHLGQLSAWRRAAGLGSVF